MTSTAATRIARHVTESHGSFPRLAHDPIFGDLEQLLIEEAVMLRFNDENAREQEMVQARQKAQDIGHARIAAYQAENA